MTEPSEFGPEVARFLLPMPVRRMDRLSDWLESAYGPDLVMHQEGQWLVVTQP